MEYQKIINLLDNTPNQPSNLGQKIGLKLMIPCVDQITQIGKLILKVGC